MANSVSPTKALMARLQFADSGGVIVVVVGDENIREPPAGFPQRRLDRRRLGSIDRGGGATLRVVQKHTEIVT